MKLDWESIASSLSPHKKIIAIVVGLVVVLIAMVWMFTGVDEWLFSRGVKKDKAAIEEKTDELRQLDKEIANLQGQREVVKEELKQDIGSFVNAANATDQARANTDQAQENTNAALAQLANVANSNTGNVNVTDIQKLLEQLP